MMKFVIVAFAIWVAAVDGRSVQHQHQHDSTAEESLLVASPAVQTLGYHVPAYSTSYSVADAITGDRKSATETRQGGVTKGSYSVLQPDGVLRTVKYVVTELGGFQAQVINTGSAVHPAVVGGKSLVAAPLVASAPIVAASSTPALVGLGGKQGAQSTVLTTLHYPSVGLGPVVGSNGIVQGVGNAVVG